MDCGLWIVDTDMDMDMERHGEDIDAEEYHWVPEYCTEYSSIV